MSFQQFSNVGGVGVGGNRMMAAANARFQPEDIKRTTGGMGSTGDNGVASHKYLLPAADQLPSSHMNSPMYNIGSTLAGGQNGVRNEGSSA